MSSNQEFVIKIPNDIIGKAWLASLDDSGGYMLSLKPIEQNSSSTVSPEKEQEEKSTESERSSLNTKAIVISKPKKLQPNNSSLKRELYQDFNNYFKINHETFKPFIEEVNLSMTHLDISGIKYEELKQTKSNNKTNNLISGKIKDLIKKIDEKNQLKLLEDIFKVFTN
ncbi:MAG: hypothetical protein AAF383_13685 [Cyanobacteria bacterium P01_A01_bin.83]